MSARRFFIGCGVTAAAIVILAVIGSIITYNRLTAKVPLPESRRLVCENSVGHAVLRLDPDNPWIRQMISEVSEVSVREPHAEEIFPIEVVWSAQRISSDSLGHILSMSFSPRGRLFGMMTDLALWRVGRSDSGKVSRVEYGGEGITAFPGTPIPGEVFVRGNSIVWSSDLDTARRAVDLVTAQEKAATAPGRAAGPNSDASAPSAAWLERVPAGTHTLAGAVSGEGGTLARCLALVPGGTVDLPAGELERADASFLFDASAADAATGELTLHFPAQTAPADVEKAAADLARWIASLKWGEVAFEASSRVEPPQAVIVVKASGLTAVYGRLMKQVVKVRKDFERARRDVRDRGETPDDPNQSSSTFQ